MKGDRAVRRYGGRSFALTVLLTALSAYRLTAQCPDGSPPPCRVAVPEARPALDSNAVVILPFRVAAPRGEAEWLREGLVDLLNLALDGVAGWRVVHPRTTLARTGRGAEFDRVDQAVPIARGVGARNLVVGLAVVAGSELRVQADLYDAVTRARVARARVHGSLGAPGPLADTLAAELARQRLLVRSGAVRHSLTEYTTHSPAALQAYLVAEQLARRAAWQEAADSLVHAVTLDSTFGLAYYRLFVMSLYGARTGPLTRHDLTKRGVPGLDRLPARQRALFLLAKTRLEGRPTETLHLADEIGRRYPDDAEVAHDEGDAYFHYGLLTGEPLQRVLEPFERAVRLDPGFLEPYFHLTHLYVMAGDTTRAWQALRHARAAGPAHDRLDLAMRALLRGESPAALARDLDPREATTILDQTQYEVLRISDGDPAGGVAIADSLAASAVALARSPADRALALLRRSAYQLARGRRQDAGRLLAEARLIGGETTDILMSEAAYALITGNLVAAWDRAPRLVAAPAATVRVVVGADPEASSLTIAALYALLAAHTGSAGALDTALMELRRRGAGTPARRDALDAGVRGVAALRRGAVDDARVFLATAHEVATDHLWGGLCEPEPRFTLELARLEHAAGHATSALRRLSGLRLAEALPYQGAAAELRGLIAEQQGDTAAAIRAHRTFVALWHDADPELQPRVATARAALARLEGP